MPARMKIVSCFTDIRELEPLAEAGADEFYTAVRELPAFSEGYLPYASLGPAIDKAHALGRKVALAVNAMHSVRLLTDPGGVIRGIRDADAMGVDALIVSNPYLLSKLSLARPRLKAELHLSSVQPVFNSLSAGFFARFGIARMILSNQLAPREAPKILSLCRRLGIGTEIFDYRFFNCAYVNGRCQLHQPGYYTLKSEHRGSMCRTGTAGGGAVRMKTLDAPGRSGETLAIMNRLAGRLVRDEVPRIANPASFYDYFAAGTRYLKYGMRQDTPEMKALKVRELREMAGLAAELSSSMPRARARRAFIERMTRWDTERFS